MSSACVILAAGRGQRMGQRNKALLSLAGKSFLATIAERCAEANISEIVVVVAEPHLAETQAEAEALGLLTTCNLDPSRGMASSVAAGFAFAQSNFLAENCWLWPVDTPAVSAQVLTTLAAAHRANSVVVPSIEGRGGHPVLVARSLWKELQACTGEPEGARTVFRRDPDRIVRIPIDEVGAMLDVDCPEDLSDLRQRVLP